MSLLLPCKRAGDTTYNTQLCQTCYATCPPGTTISPLVDRCSGKTRAMTPDYSTAPFDPVSECVPCPPCEYATGMARVAGCTGTSRYDPPRCEACLNTCSLGEYIVGECSTSSTVAQCVQCPACEVGKYLARPCTGTKLGEPDQVCGSASKDNIQSWLFHSFAADVCFFRTGRSVSHVPSAEQTRTCRRADGRIQCISRGGSL